MLTRRSFIVAGLAGGAALSAAYWLRSTRQGLISTTAGSGPVLDRDATAVITAVVPALLGNALPDAPSDRSVAVDETVANVAHAIGGLAPAAQKELAELFSLLSFAPARIALARVTSSWDHASPVQVEAFLERWRQSDWKLLRSAYDALHQLVYAAWYSNPRSWASIGYGGPPAISS